MMLLEPLNTLLVKSNLHDFVMGEECEVQNDSNEVRLGAVVLVIVVSINDIVLSTVQVCCVVLERLIIVGVS